MDTPKSFAKSNRVAVIIVNWNRWRDTIECLESVFRLDYPDFRVVVCDNGSDDGSPERIKEWARGELEVELDKANPLWHLVSPSTPKPITFIEFDRDAAEDGGFYDEKDARLILINTGSNLGFAGGNNVGLRYALANGGFEYAWLLNNDTVVEPDALTHLVRRTSERPDCGICGSTILYYDVPNKVQALAGGIFNKWLALSWHVGNKISADQLIDPRFVEQKMSYVTGASMLVSSAFVKDVGLMNDEYFLYFEEIDWANRAHGLYSLAYAPKSIVYHKEGASIRSKFENLSKKSAKADFYSNANRLVFTRKYFPLALPTVYFGLLITILHRLCHGHIYRAIMVARLMVGSDYKTGIFKGKDGDKY